jgi:hypothetical protein
MTKPAKRTLDDVIVPDDRFAAAEKALEVAPKKLPSVSPPPAPKSPDRERKASSLSLPEYVWRQLKQRSYGDDEPQNIVVLKALKAYGFEIHEDDLVDPRKLRYQ